MILSHIKRIYIIPDIHGDYLAFYTCMRYLAAVLNPDGSWGQKNTAVVFMGDIVDRQRRQVPSAGEFVGEEEMIIDTINAMSELAKKHQSIVVKLVGNHETMRVIHADHRYATDMSRKLDFSPGSDIACKIAKHAYAIASLNGLLLCHGGVSPECAREDLIERSNGVIERLFTTKKSHHRESDLDYYRRHVTPFLWNRYFGDKEGQKIDCSLINSIFKKLDPKNKMNLHRMIVAHSPQYGCNNTINEKRTLCCELKRTKFETVYGGAWVDHNRGKSPVCGVNGQCMDSSNTPRIIRTDVAMSRAFTNPLEHPNKSRLPQVIELECSEGRTTGECKLHIVNMEILEKLYRKPVENVRDGALKLLDAIREKSSEPNTTKEIRIPKKHHHEIGN